MAARHAAGDAFARGCKGTCQTGAPHARGPLGLLLGTIGFGVVAGTNSVGSPSCADNQHITITFHCACRELDASLMGSGRFCRERPEANRPPVAILARVC